MSFRKIQPTSGPPVYVVDDEEIDFETILKEEPVPIPRAARYTGPRPSFSSNQCNATERS